jgi:hypothetical protein
MYGRLAASVRPRADSVAGAPASKVACIRQSSGRAIRFWVLTLAAIAAFSLIVFGLLSLLAYFYDR